MKFGIDSPPIEAAGSAGDNLVKRCEAGSRPPRDPARRERGHIALAFSGGGWRAALTAAGVVRFLAEAGILGKVRWASSVSGGSITNGLLAVSHEEIAATGFSAEAVDRAVIAPLLGAARERSLTMALLRNSWRAARRSRTGVLADVLAQSMGFDVELADLSRKCSYVFNAANETTGVRFNFDAEGVGDYVIGFRSPAGTGLRVADAVAMSAAVPGPFNAMPLTGIDFPCGDGAEARIADGGAYDNLGLEAIDDLHGPCLVVVSAGGVFRTGWRGALNHVPLVKDLKRAEALLYRQATALRTRTMIERFRLWERTPPGDDPPAFARRGVLFGLATEFSPADAWSRGRPEFPHGEDRVELATFKTTFNKIDASIAEALIHRGWWLAGASLATYQADLLPADLPTWRALPTATMGPVVWT